MIRPGVLGPLPGAPAGQQGGPLGPPEAPPELPGGTGGGVADKEESGLEGISQYSHFQISIVNFICQLMPDDEPSWFES